MKEHDPLSSISWQLKRIADALESINQKFETPIKPKIKNTGPYKSKLEQMLAELDSKSQ